MARTVDAEEHARRRKAYLDAAQTLIQTVGYEQMSVQDVLDAVGASRGALYHYFPSKASLLDGVVERLTTAALASFDSTLADASLPAPEKLAGLFRAMADWKAQRRDLILALLRVWLSEDNAVVRERLRAHATRELTPRLTAIVVQGVREGTFDVRSTEATARVLVTLVLGAQDLSSRLFLECQAGHTGIDTAVATLEAVRDAFVRVLSTDPQRLRLVDPEVVRAWFS